MHETRQTREKITELAGWREVAVFAACSVLILFVIGTLYLQQRGAAQNLQENQAVSRAHQLGEVFQQDLARSFSSIQFLASLKQTRDANIDSPESLNELAATFIQFAQSQKRYLQVRLLDRKGKEIVRVNWNGKQAERVTGEILQDKSTRDYFMEALKLAPGETYVSDLNLNREFGKIERPLTPVIRIATPVKLDSGDAGNIVILNYDCQDLFEELVQDTSAGNTLLIRNDGNFIIGPTPESEWGWELGHSVRLEQLYPEVAGELNKASTEEGVVWAGKGLFAFAAVHLEPPEDHDISSPLSTYWFLEYVPPDDSLASLQKWGTGLLTGFATLIPLIALIGIWHTTARQRHRTALIAKHQLEKNEAKLRGIFDNSSNFVGLLTPDGTVIDINRTALEVIDAQEDEVINQFFWDTLWWDGDLDLQMRIREAVGKAAAGQCDRFEAKINGAEGQLIDLDITVSPIFSASGDVLYIIPEGHDITFRMKQEKALKESYQRLEETNYDLDHFVYVASHDLRSPLRGISQLAAFIIEDEADKLSESSQEYLVKLQTRIERMQALIDDLIAYSRVNKDQSRLEQVDLAHLITEIVELIGIPAGFQVSVPDELPRFVTCVTPLRQVLMNLIGNAVKHHDKDQGHIQVNVTETETHYEFSVADDGPGIEERYYDQIFDMFRTLKPRYEVEGSGMGLAIIRKFVYRYGGEVSVDSTPGEGTTFRFTWPKTIKIDQPETANIVSEVDLVGRVSSR